MQGKHFAATYALHTINWDKSMHRLMPPPYKAYWEELEVGRKDKFAVKLNKVEEQKVPKISNFNLALGRFLAHFSAPCRRTPYPVSSLSLLLPSTGTVVF